MKRVSVHRKMYIFPMNVLCFALRSRGSNFGSHVQKYTFSQYMCTVLLSFFKIWVENKAKVFEAKKLHFNWENKQFRLPVTGNTHFCGKSALFCLELITFTRKMSETFFFEAFSSQKWLFLNFKAKKRSLMSHFWLCVD